MARKNMSKALDSNDIKKIAQQAIKEIVEKRNSIRAELGMPLLK